MTTDQRPETVQNPAESHEIPSDHASPGAERDASPEIPTDSYAAAVETYLDAATWLQPEDVVLKVHARSVAKSLDRQMARSGEVQSALASTFAKVLAMLDNRRPGPPPADPLTEGVGPHGEASLFSTMD